MPNAALGRLQKLDLRDHWEREDTEFTPWLAHEENIVLLGEAIGMELEVQAQETGVGPYRADILCRNTVDNSLVLIENQLERTDHVHLGQLLTYAAGLKAATLVWVVQRFTDEHRAALDWLNQITEEGFYFFGLEVELWRIGDSLAAPKFNVVVKPNEWSRTVREAASDQLSSIAQLKRDFWFEFAAFLELQGQRDQLPLAKPHNWQGWGIGRSGFQLCAGINVRDGRVSVYLNLNGPDAEAHFQLLMKERARIDRDLGLTLEWERGEKERKLVIRRDADVSDRARWPELHRWIHATLQQFRRVFRDRVRELDAEDWIELPSSLDAVGTGDATST